MARSAPRRRPVSSDSEQEQESVVSPQKKSRQLPDADAFLADDDEIEIDVGPISFTQAEPVLTQSMPQPNKAELKISESIPAIEMKKLIAEMLRYLIFKAFSNEPIDKAKATEDVLGDAYKGKRMISVVFEEAGKKLKALYGFDLSKVPLYMLSALPAKYANRYYVCNILATVNEPHSTAIHNRYDSSDRGLLLVILTIIFNKGTPRDSVAAAAAAGKTKWCSEELLYEKLNDVDSNLPSEPSKTKGSTTAENMVPPGLRKPLYVLIQLFVDQEYLMIQKEKSLESDSSGIFYAMGPRSALEVGREQLIFFAANVLESKPDEAMLQELKDSLEAEKEDVEEEE